MSPMKMREHLRSRVRRAVAELGPLAQDVDGLIDDVERADEPVHRYIRFELQKLAERPDALEALEGHLGAAARSLAPHLLERLRSLRR